MPNALCHDALKATPHGFFGRYGGFSTGLYQSLNCGLGSADSPEAVHRNLDSVQDHFGAESLRTLRQIHSNRVVTVTENHDGMTRPEADALVTRQPGIALGVLSADCAPILFADSVSGVIGAAHAGWKGALSGIAEATVAAMCALGAEARCIVAVIGPAIARISYEVDADFRARFLEQDSACAACFDSGKRTGRYQFDLEAFLLDRLQAMALKTVSCLGVDTYPAQNGYFSCRRCTHQNEADYGRQISAIMLPKTV